MTTEEMRQELDAITERRSGVIIEDQYLLGVRDERKRIRRELLDAFKPFESLSNELITTAEQFVDVLDRVCPGEIEAQYSGKSK